MYNLSNHYENIYQYLRTIIAYPRVAYLHPFGSTQPENLEIIRNDIDPPDRQNPLQSWGPLFICWDQEPLNYTYNKNFFDYLVSNTKGPYILVNTERDSEEKLLICEKYGFASIDYFFHIFAAHDWYRGHEYIPGIVSPADRQLKKTYITFNRLTSNERIYRSLFVNELYKNNLLESGYVSFSRDCPDGGSYIDNLCLGIKNQRVDTALVEEAITNNFKKEIYLPLLKILGESRKTLKNSIDDFKEAIQSFTMMLNEIHDLLKNIEFKIQNHKLKWFSYFRSLNFCDELEELKVKKNILDRRFEILQKIYCRF
jgi:hypothetical protein